MGRGVIDRPFGRAISLDYARQELVVDGIIVRELRLRGVTAAAS